MACLSPSPSCSPELPGWSFAAGVPVPDSSSPQRSLRHRGPELPAHRQGSGAPRPVGVEGGSSCWSPEEPLQTSFCSLLKDRQLPGQRPLPHEQNLHAGSEGKSPDEPELDPAAAGRPQIHARLLHGPDQQQVRTCTALAGGSRCFRCPSDTSLFSFSQSEMRCVLVMVTQSSHRQGL